MSTSYCPTTEDYSNLRKNYNQLKTLKDRIYRDATNFKKKSQEYERRIISLEGELSGLNRLYEDTRKKNESVLYENSQLKSYINLNSVQQQAIV